MLSSSWWKKSISKPKIFHKWTYKWAVMDLGPFSIGFRASFWRKNHQEDNILWLEMWCDCSRRVGMVRSKNQNWKKLWESSLKRTPVRTRSTRNLMGWGKFHWISPENLKDRPWEHKATAVKLFSSMYSRIVSSNSFNIWCWYFFLCPGSSLSSQRQQLCKWSSIQLKKLLLLLFHLKDRRRDRRP